MSKLIHQEVIYFSVSGNPERTQLFLRFVSPSKLQDHYFTCALELLGGKEECFQDEQHNWKRHKKPCRVRYPQCWKKTKKQQTHIQTQRTTKRFESIQYGKKKLDDCQWFISNLLFDFIFSSCSHFTYWSEHDNYEIKLNPFDSKNRQSVKI